ncbi:MAG: hypothetical protein NZ741_13085, partial [Armatimonadetes bacterium]|nr:hypothetical protein [Armatimonadota bacterium]
MRYLIPMMVGAVAFLLSAAFAQEHTVRLNGQVRFMTTAGEEAARYMSFQNAVTLRKEPPKGVKLPAWANSSCRYGSLKLGKPPQEW